MREFNELIKNFDRIRDYMRQFFIYGYKSRGDYGEKSARTYDNERRRIESWLAGYIQSGYAQKEKHVYISVDSKTIPQNPLYAAWKSKSFTDKDILLHFLIPDCLWDHPEGMTTGKLCDQIAERYGIAFEGQTIRLKLKEYEEAELLESRKEGKSLYYQLRPGPGASLPSSLWQDLLTAVTFFQEAAPFGFVGSTILDHENQKNRWFQFKHHFIVHTLEDGVLATILSAMHQHLAIFLENKSSRSGHISYIKGVPLKILVSTQTGRRYLCLYLEERRRFNNFRLDSIARVAPLEVCPEYDQIHQDLERNLSRCWGVSFNGVCRMEEVCLKLFADEEREPYIIDRLQREKRGGEVLKIRKNQYLYSGFFFDSNEMLSWIKTFTGRILDIQGSNRFAIAKLIHDLEKMYHMYTAPDALAQSLSSRSSRSSSKADILFTPHPSPALPPLSPGTDSASAELASMSSMESTSPELFHKLYSCYYQAVRQILAEASLSPITRQQMTELSIKYGFLESSLSIIPRLMTGEWPLLLTISSPPRAPKSDTVYRSLLMHPDALFPGSLPLSRLQKSWLKALLKDPKIQLFLSTAQIEALEDWLSSVSPLYQQEDFDYFDQYLDGDPFDSPALQRCFKTILAALQQKKALILAYKNRHGQISTFTAAPYQLQYSLKDNKFRLCCLKHARQGFRQNTILNLNRIQACHLSHEDTPPEAFGYSFHPIHRSPKPVVIEISGERNSLERCMLHFANYEKHTQYQEETKSWLCSIYYDLADEAELLIDILSFGPVIRVLGPESFLAQLKSRVERQHELFYGSP